MVSTNPFFHIKLNENDVPGAKLMGEVEAHSNVQLKRWLECRGLVRSGNRQELIKRYECIFMLAITRISDVPLNS